MPELTPDGRRRVGSASGRGGPAGDASAAAADAAGTCGHPAAASSVNKMLAPMGLPPNPCEKTTSGWRTSFAEATFAGAPICGLASTSGCWFGRAGYQMSVVNLRVCPSDVVLVNVLEVKPTADGSETRGSSVG